MKVEIDVKVLNDLIEAAEMYNHAISDAHNHCFTPELHPDWDAVLYLQSQYSPSLNAAREIIRRLPQDQLSDYLIFGESQTVNA